MSKEIAIIGMAGRFPDAGNVGELLGNLRGGRNSIRALSARRTLDTTLPAGQEYKPGGYLEDVDKFDHAFFNISLTEAQAMDPHQRLLLEVAYEAFENAGYCPGRFDGTSTSVFVNEVDLVYYQHADHYVPMLETGNSNEFIASRISRHFNLQGSALVVNASCASSLVALHVACNELRAGDSDYALVCGVNLELVPVRSESLDLDVVSPNGRSAAFSAQANGMTYGETVACLLLKPLDKALADADLIHGVIKGSAVNNNAHRAASMTAPDGLAQAAVLRRAWEKAGVNPLEIAFVEAHGSGTQLGDSIEVGGLNEAFRAYTDQKRICPIATVKANIGHCRGASGLAGVIKAVLSLKSGEIFPGLYADDPSPLIDFDSGAVYVSGACVPFAAPPGARRVAGVSSIGINGTNCHVILEEPPRRPPSGDRPGQSYLVTTSARTPSGLAAHLQALLRQVQGSPALSLHDLSYTLGAGRNHFRHRFAAVVRSAAELEAAIRASGDQPPAGDGRKARKLVFVFQDSGQLTEAVAGQFGSRYPVFARHFDALRALRVPGTPDAPFLDFAFQFCLYQLLVSWGLAGDVVGTGAGKIAVDALRQKISLPEALLRVGGYEAVPVADLAGRVARLLAAETAHDTPVFFLCATPPTPLSEQLRAGAAANPRADVLEVFGPGEPLLPLLRTLYLAGHALDFPAFFAGSGPAANRVELFTYQFERTRCWLRDEPRSTPADAAGAPAKEAENAFLVSGLAGEEKPLTQWVARVWCAELGIAQLDAGDDFFALGGDSLTASKVITALNGAFAAELSFEDLFDFPVFKQFAGYVEAALSAADKVMFFWKEALKLEAVHPEDDFFLLGGHSLIANQVINKIGAQFGVDFDFDLFYQFPTVRALARYLEEAGQNETRRTDPGAASGLEEQQHYELSYAQQRQWIMNRLEEKAAVYNIQAVNNLEGPLDRELFQGAIARVVARHESLRTVFRLIDGRPRQVVIDSAGFDCKPQYLDLRGNDNPDAVIDAIIAREATTAFDLSAGPLFKILLARTGEQQHVFMLFIHHIIFDTWSLNVFTGEVSACYGALRRGQRAVLPELRFQYKDYCRWENSQLRSRLTEYRQYWTSKLAGVVPGLSLDLEPAPAAHRSHEGDSYLFRLDADQKERVRKYNLKHRSTSFCTALAVLKVLLYKHSGQPDIVVGTPVARRTSLRMEDQIGLYLNSLVLRDVVAEEAPFTDFLRQVNATVDEARKYQVYPYDMLVGDLELHGRGLEDPLLAFGINWMNTNEGSLPAEALPGIAVSERPAGQFLVKHKLWLYGFEEDSGITLELRYLKSAFTRAAIGGLAAEFTRLLDEVLAREDIRTGELAGLLESGPDKQLFEERIRHLSGEIEENF